MKSTLFEPTEHEPDGNCETCGFRKDLSSKEKGVKLPGEFGLMGPYGKCVRPGGKCLAASPQPLEPTVSLVTPLSKKEQQRRKELEEQIYESVTTAFANITAAVKEITEKRLYRNTHKTVEAYFKEIWDITRGRVYQYIRAASVLENVYNCTQIDIAPQNEAQVRALVPLTPEEQVEAWEKAVNTAPNGRITAAHVKKTVRRLTGGKQASTIGETRTRVNKSDLISKEFKQAFQTFLDAVSAARIEKWQTTSRKQVVKHLAAITKVLAEEDALEGYEIPDGDLPPLPASDRVKVIAAGFSLWRTDKTAKAIKCLNEKGNWIFHEKFKTAAAMQRAMAEILQDHMSIMG